MAATPKPVRKKSKVQNSSARKGIATTQIPGTQKPHEKSLLKRFKGDKKSIKSIKEGTPSTKQAHKLNKQPYAKVLMESYEKKKAKKK